MEKYCKNCGANISDADAFCPDCGKEIPITKHAIIYCPNCGERISGYENFCKNCGTKIKTPKKEKDTFLEKFNAPIIFLAVIAVIAIVAIGAFIMLMPTPVQEVQVDTIDFSIPDGFVLDDDLSVDENDEGIKVVSKVYASDSDVIQIDVLYSISSYVDANEVAIAMGGEKQNMMGYDGYYNEFTDGYSFSFVKDNKMVTVYTTQYDTLNEIEVL